ncbi:N-acetylmuramoyl-L-alanine amidase [Candidatus Woesearchaeota archaeon]|nr:N-acetylmuramoyl-L-alanine amidase [Candidatus Woesearchaeota archaeon]
MNDVKHIRSEGEELFFTSLKEGLEYLKAKKDSKAMIKQVLTMPILFQKPKYLCGQMLERTSEIFYSLQKQGNLDILKAIYPIDGASMSPNQKISSLIIHHTGNSAEYDVPKILRLQTERTGWAAIGYHYFINSDGVIINTRSSELEGAHVYGHNRGSIGLVLSKNLNSAEPTPEMLKAVNNLISWLQEKYSIPNTQIYGHIQFVLDDINKKIETENKKSGRRLENICEKSFLNVKNVIEFKELKLKYASIFDPEKSITKEEHHFINEINSKILHLRACPGVNFYKHLLELRQNKENQNKENQESQ